MKNDRILNTIPTTIPNGGEVIAFKLIYRGNDKANPLGLALCLFPHKEGHWATWMVLRRPDGTWHPEGGRHWWTRSLGVEDFHNRVKEWTAVYGELV